MPHVAPLVGAAIATGVGQLGGALIGSHASSSAAKRAQESTNQAIQLQREQMAESQRRYDAQMAWYRQAYEQREAVRRELLRRYGVNIPEPTARAGQVKAYGAAPGLSLGSMIGASPSRLMDSQSGTAGALPTASESGPSMVPPKQGMTLADLAGWSDWRRYAVQ